MNISRFDKNKTAVKKALGGLAIALFSGLSLSTLAIAQSTSFTAVESAQLSSTLEFVPPPLPDRGRPRGRSSGTASRGSCELAGRLPLTALVPVTQVQPETTENNEVSIAYDSVFSLTTQPSPAYWFYVPYDLSTTRLEFVLQDENSQTLYQADYSSAMPVGTTGVVKVEVPVSEVTLAESDRYHWFFMAYCDEDAPSFVEGWIERSPEVAVPEVAASETVALEAAKPSVGFIETSPRENAQAYAENGIWQDAITTVGEQVLAGDINALNDWESLLSSVGLEAIAQQPLVNCCEP